MKALDTAITELKNLAPAQQDTAAKFIHSLKRKSKAHRQTIIDRTFGCLSEIDAAEWESAIADCPQIEHGSW